MMRGMGVLLPVTL